MSIICSFRAYVGLACFCISSSLSSRIFVYDLPGRCAYSDFQPEELRRRQPLNPPALPIHERIVSSTYTTKDPNEASLFYIPAPFFLFDNSDRMTQPEFPKRLFKEALPRFVYASTTIELATRLHAFDGGASWTISLWFKAEIANGLEVSHLQRITFVGTGGPYDVGLKGGCVALLARRKSTTGEGGQDFSLDLVEPGCANTSIVLDGRWHHVAFTYDQGGGGTWQLYVDSSVRGLWKNISVVGDLVARSGHFNPTMVGELREFQVFAQALTQIQVRGVPGGAYSPEAPCFQLIRETVEAMPWLRRNQGSDHFVLFGGIDYPAASRVNMPLEPQDYVLEAAWPAFRSFSVLHFGSRAEICVGLQYLPDEACYQRFSRMVTIPPLVEEEPFDCEAMAKLMRVDRPVRISFRGLAYGAVLERMLIQNVVSLPIIRDLQHTGQLRIEFTNWTQEVIDHGGCTEHAALKGLCPWKAIGRNYRNSIARRASKMRRLSKSSIDIAETCFVLPGDGGYELRLYSAINSGCVPVIVFTSLTTHPRVPFASQLPWHEIAIFWDISHSRILASHINDPALLWSATQLLTQLLALDPRVLGRKRDAILRHGPKLGWAQQEHCRVSASLDGAAQLNALDLTVNELILRAKTPISSISQQQAWSWKVPANSITIALDEDLSGTGCPAGYPVCVTPENVSYGVMCASFIDDSVVGFRCPMQCRQLQRAPWCVKSSASKPYGPPCRIELPCKEIDFLQVDYSLNGFPVPPRNSRIKIISLSERPRVRGLTWAFLHRFCDTNPGRYALELNREALLDARDFDAAWNKWAFMRRAFNIVEPRYTEELDAAVWVDEDVVLTLSDGKDLLYDTLVQELFADSDAFALIASRNSWPFGPSTSELDRLNLSTAFFALKRDRRSHVLINEMMKAARLARRSNNLGLTDEKVLATVIRASGSLKGYKLLEYRHGRIVRPPPPFGGTTASIHIGAIAGQIEHMVSPRRSLAQSLLKVFNVTIRTNLLNR